MLHDMTLAKRHRGTALVQSLHPGTTLGTKTLGVTKRDIALPRRAKLLLVWSCFFWPNELSLCFAYEFTALENGLPTQNCANDGSTQFSSDIRALAMQIVQGICCNNCLCVWVDQREIGVFSDSESALPRNPAAFC